MRTMTTVMWAVMVLVSASPFAQARPNLSGKWVLDAAKTAAAGPPGAAGVGPITIAMNAASVRITVPSKDGSGKATTYRLDGPMKKIRMAPVGGGVTTEENLTASIEGDKVVIRTTGTNGDSVTSWYLEGSWLVNERATSAGTVKTFYKKG